MTKAEELGRKKREDLTDSDWDYIMTMDHVEYKEYSRAKSIDHGYIRHLRDTGVTYDNNI